MPDAAARIARTAAIDAHLTRLRVMDHRARMGVLRSLTGAAVAAVHDLDEGQGARAIAYLESCASGDLLPGLIGKLERCDCADPVVFGHAFCTRRQAGQEHIECGCIACPCPCHDKPRSRRSLAAAAT